LFNVHLTVHPIENITEDSKFCTHVLCGSKKLLLKRSAVNSQWIYLMDRAMDCIHNLRACAMKQSTVCATAPNGNWFEEI